MSGEKLCIGIDLGTTNSCLAYFNPESEQVEIIPNPLGERITPSVVRIKEDGNILVGKLAEDDYADEQNDKNGRDEVNADNGDEDSGNGGVGREDEGSEDDSPGYPVISHVKRFIGKKYQDSLDIAGMVDYTLLPDHNDNPLIHIGRAGSSDGCVGNGGGIRKYKAEEISAQVLRYLKEYGEEYLGQPINQAVVTCPAYFSESQRRATKDACMIAGLECLRLVAEPTSACLCYGLHKSNHEVVLVYDLGGGTLDVSILELHDGIFEVLATSGNTQLGGADVDHLLRDYLEKLYRENSSGKSINIGLPFAESIKKTLSNLVRTTVRLPGFKYVLSRSEFEEQLTEFVEMAMDPIDQVLSDAGLDTDDISQVVLVGGSTRLPIIQKKLSEIFPQRPLNKSINPDEAVAYGAAIQASILKNVGSRSREMILLDVNPLSLGIETTGGIMNVLIKRNSTLPCEAKKVFSTVDDNQEVVEIKVFQGERQFTNDNIQLSTFLLEGLPRAARGVPKIVVTFKLNCDGLLEVAAVDKNTGLENSVSIQQESNLDESEIQKMIQDAEKFKTQDYNRRQAIDEYNRFEAHIYELQRQVNLPEMEVILGEEKSQLNQYLINTVEWLVANRDADLETIQACRETVDFNLKPYMNRMYSHQEDLQKSGVGHLPGGGNQDGSSAMGMQEMVDDICADLDN